VTACRCYHLVVCFVIGWMIQRMVVAILIMIMIAFTLITLMMLALCML
jgi:hypothetical protein